MQRMYIKLCDIKMTTATIKNKSDINVRLICQVEQLIDNADLPETPLLVKFSYIYSS